MKEIILDIFYVTVVVACLALFVNMAVTSKENTDVLTQEYADQMIASEISMADNELMKYAGCELTGLEVRNIISTYKEYQYNLNVKINEDSFSYVIVNRGTTFKDVYKRFAYFLKREIVIDDSTLSRTLAVWYENDKTRCYAKLVNGDSDLFEDIAAENGTNVSEYDSLTRQLPLEISTVLKDKAIDGSEYKAVKIERVAVSDIGADDVANDDSLGPNGEFIEDMIFSPLFKYKAYPLYNSDGRWVIGLAFDYTE